MKKIIISLTISLATLPALAVDFSAFAKDGFLYVTTLADSCNAKGASLELDESCKSNRTTKQLTLKCNARLHIIQTLKACSDEQLIPQVFTLNLKQQNVTPEAISMDLKYGDDDVISVELQKLSQ